jgi:hypothetical protein
VIAKRTERIPGLPAACGPIPDDRRNDLVEAGLTSRHQIASCQAFPGFCAPPGKQRQILRRGPGLVRSSLLQRTNTQDPKTRAISAYCASAVAVQYKTPEPM